MEDNKYNLVSKYLKSLLLCILVYQHHISFTLNNAFNIYIFKVLHKSY